MFDRINHEEKTLGHSLISSDFDFPYNINNSILEKNQSHDLEFVPLKTINKEEDIFPKLFSDISKTKVKTPKKNEKKKKKNRKYSNTKKEEKEKKTLIKKKRGRRRKSEFSGIHNKFSDDNLRRKCKHILINELQIFINNKIKEIYNNKIGEGLFIKQLFSMNQKQKSNANILFNRQFLNKTLKDIFSEKLSTRYTIIPLDYNKLLIESLINEPDDEKRNFFQNLFNITFIQSLRHFRGSEIIPELIGLNGLDKIKEKYNLEDEYYKTLLYYFNKYEDIINNRRIRRYNKKE